MSRSEALSPRRVGLVVVVRNGGSVVRCVRSRVRTPTQAAAGTSPFDNLMSTLREHRVKPTNMPNSTFSTLFGLVLVRGRRLVIGGLGFKAVEPDMRHTVGQPPPFLTASGVR